MLTCTWYADIVNDAIALAGVTDASERAADAALAIWESFGGAAVPVPPGADLAERRRLGAVRVVVTDGLSVEVDMSFSGGGDADVAFGPIATRRVAQILTGASACG